jgi:hypothetical protein
VRRHGTPCCNAAQPVATTCFDMLPHVGAIGSCGAARAIPRQAAARIVIVRCASHGPGQPYRAAQARRGKARPGNFRALGYLGRVRKSKQRPSPRKVHSSSRIRASAVVCVRLDARHTCACALVIPSNASASSRRLQRGLWAQNCTHWGYCRVRPTAPRLIPSAGTVARRRQGRRRRKSGWTENWSRGAWKRTGAHASNMAWQQTTWSMTRAKAQDNMAQGVEDERSHACVRAPHSHRRTQPTQFDQTHAN